MNNSILCTKLLVFLSIFFLFHHSGGSSSSASGATHDRRLTHDINIEHAKSSGVMLTLARSLGKSATFCAICCVDSMNTMRCYTEDIELRNNIERDTYEVFSSRSGIFDSQVRCWAKLE